MQNNTLKKALVPPNMISGIRRSVMERRAALVVIFCTGLMSVPGVATGREAHTHGAGNLTLVYENGVLEIQFDSPAMSLLGFEHKPKTRAQVDSIKKTKALLNSPEKIVSVNGGNCSPSTVNVKILGPAGQALNNNHSQEHGHHNAGEKNVEHDQSNASHSEASATYVFDCLDGEDLESATISLFEYFSGLEQINVNWIVETQQGGSILRPTSSTITFE